MSNVIAFIIVAVVISILALNGYQLYQARKLTDDDLKERAVNKAMILFCIALIVAEVGGGLCILLN